MERDLKQMPSGHWCPTGELFSEKEVPTSVLISTIGEHAETFFLFILLWIKNPVPNKIA